MSGFANLPKPGPAVVNTVYFGTVPDKYNMLCTGYFNPGGSITLNGWAPANLIANWVPYNQSFLGGSNILTSSLGATTSAPDGSSNGQKLVDTATDTVHAAITAFTDNNNYGNWVLRISVFAKAADYTRFALYVCSAGFDAATSLTAGAKTVYDLAGGQIGVVCTAYNNNASNPAYTPIGQEIVNFGGGWYRCSMDVKLGQGASNANGYQIAILLDNGSGTGAESTTFTGTGSRGVYFWRSTALPPGAWGINTVTLFDDFTSLDTIDLNQTGDAGFKWYTNSSQWGNYINNIPNTPANLFSIKSGTILKIAGNGAAKSPFMLTASPENSGASYLGFTFQPSALIEISMGWDSVFPAEDPLPQTYWTHSVEFLLNSFADVLDFHSELDFMEMPPGGNNWPACTMANAAEGGSGIVQTQGCYQGYPAWSSGFDFITASMWASYLAQFYESLQATMGNIPASSPTFWSQTNPSPAIPNAPIFNWNDQNVFATLWIAESENDTGHVINFFNGGFCFGYTQSTKGTPAHMIYAPILFNVPGGGTGEAPNPFYNCQRTNYPVMIGTGNNLDTYIDYVRVTQ